MRIVACLIVRDAEQVLDSCLDSLRPHVDEVNVYLGGVLVDGTAKLVERHARRPGVPLRWTQGEWRDDSPGLESDRSRWRHP